LEKKLGLRDAKTVGILKVREAWNQLAVFQLANGKGKIINEK
jgi:hypothetical protein